MSPFELPGKPYLGHLNDQRNGGCYHCGREFRYYRLNQTESEEQLNQVSLICPLCKEHLESIPLSRVTITEYR